MKTVATQTPGDSSAEIAALIEDLHKTGQRLEQLTGGEVDSVTSHAGRTFLLQHAQDQLRVVEATKQAAILNALPANIALLDTQGLIVSVNDAWRRFGEANAALAPGHGVGVNYLTICDSARGEDSAEARQAGAGIRSVLAGETQRFALEYPCHSATQQRWFMMTVTPLSEGHPNGVVVMHSDISERKRTEAERIKFLDVLEASLNEIYIFDAHNLHFDYVNEGARRNLGYTMDEMRQQTPLSFKPEFTEAAFHKLIEPLRRHEKPKIVFQTVHRRANGSHYPVEVHLQLVERAGKGVFLAVINDLTESKQAEQALRTSVEEFRTLAESMPQMVWITRADGWTIYLNPQWMEYTGRTLEESLGQGWLESIHPEEQQQAWDAWQQAVAAIGVYSIESRICGADGVYRWWLIRGVPLQDASGKILKWFGTCTDINDLKIAELEVTHSNQALRKSETQIKYLNRVYAMLSGINNLIVRIRDRDELFREACRVAVDIGGFRMSLICILDRVTMKIVPVASAGKDEMLMNGIKTLITSSEMASNTMVARAIREGKVIVSNESKNDPQVLLSKQYIEFGVHSIAVFPLIVAAETIGVIALYASESEFFHKEELNLLTDLTEDIAFGIDHIEKRERLDYLAYYDVLTGLANRTLFHQRLEQAVIEAKEHGNTVALVLIDIERFKTINDTLGRPTGDALLKAVAARMVESSGDVARLGRLDADHFAVMAKEQTGEELARLLEQRIAEIFVPPYRIGDSELRVTAKFGVALFPNDGADADSLFRNAEAALKNAKTGGERYLFYTQAMNARVAEKHTLENHLRQALENDEFVLHYQPKTDLASGKLTSAEALIRWMDPRTGLVPPGRFIPILEETGLINEVGRWALRQAVADYLRWFHAGLPAVRIAVNLSPLQLRHRGFIAEIKAAIGVDVHAAAGLELEITESLIMEDVKHSIESFKAIRDLGITIAIDDFGTGFSSLSYLAKLPVDTLKIDRSFVVDMTAGPEGLALVATIINLAHSLKLKVVAEGVETEEQARLLRLLGCDEMQGFLVSKALARDIFEEKFLVMPAAG